MAGGKEATGGRYCGWRKGEKSTRKKAQKLEKERRGEEDEGHTSFPRGIHKEAVKHHVGFGGKPLGFR
jgi:hypothetical protein